MKTRGNPAAGSCSPSPLAGEGSGRGGKGEVTPQTLRARMTDAEQRLWLHLRAHRLNGEKFRRQQPLGPYIVDFVHFGARLVIEADGGQHLNSEGDAVRDAWLASQGFRVLRFWNHEILRDTDSVLAVILAAVQSPLSPNPSPASGEGSDPPDH